MKRKTPTCDCGHAKYHHIKKGVKYPPCRSCDCDGYSVSVNIQAKAVRGQAKALPPVAPPKE